MGRETCRTASTLRPRWRIRAAVGDEAGLNGDQPQNTGGRKPHEEGLECKEERTQGLPADREQIELPAVHAVHAVHAIDERSGEEPERDEWNRLCQPGSG